MILFLRFVATMAVLGVAGMLSVPAAAHERAAGFVPMAIAPEARPPGYDLARGMFVVASRRPRSSRDWWTDRPKVWLSGREK